MENLSNIIGIATLPLKSANVCTTSCRYSTPGVLREDSLPEEKNYFVAVFSLSSVNYSFLDA